MARHHSDKHINAAMEYAFSLGWTFEKAGPRAHAYGRMKCPHACLCQFSIYGTPRVPEHHADYIRRQVDRCSLGQPDPPAETQAPEGDSNAEE